MITIIRPTQFQPEKPEPKPTPRHVEIWRYAEPRLAWLTVILLLLLILFQGR